METRVGRDVLDNDGLDAPVAEETLDRRGVKAWL
jgi:hypothetical protein